LLDEPAQHAVIRGLQIGDRDAWAKLYDSYSLDVWRFVARLLGTDTTTVADVVQETFLEAAGAAKRFDPSRGTLWQWLTGIAHHRVTAHWRQANRLARLRKLAESQAIDASRWLYDGQQASQPAEQRELAELVRGALAELSPDYAAILVAKYLDERSLSEISAQWGSTVEAIKSKLARARAEFRSTCQRLFAPSHAGAQIHRDTK
jgi:RNA polymerase sigma-70 factor, ECF subfamily